MLQREHWTLDVFDIVVVTWHRCSCLLFDSMFSKLARMLKELLTGMFGHTSRVWVSDWGLLGGVTLDSYIVRSHPWSSSWFELRPTDIVDISREFTSGKLDPRAVSGLDDVLGTFRLDLRGGSGFRVGGNAIGDGIDDGGVCWLDGGLLVKKYLRTPFSYQSLRDT